MRDLWWHIEAALSDVLLRRTVRVCFAAALIVIVLAAYGIALRLGGL